MADKYELVAITMTTLLGDLQAKAHALEEIADGAEFDVAFQEELPPTAFNYATQHSRIVKLLSEFVELIESDTDLIADILDISVGLDTDQGKKILASGAYRLQGNNKYTPIPSIKNTK